MRRNVIFMALLLCVSSVLFAQEQKLSRREQRAKAKQLEQEQKSVLDQQKKNITQLIIDSAAWVLEADMLYNRYGRSVNVNSTLNFVGVKGEYSTVQLGNETAMGLNGVGGITVEGRISKYKVDYIEKSESYSILMMVTSNAGTFDIQINCSGDGTRADATIRGNRPYSIRYSGRLIPVAMSTVYKGTPIF